ncbi:hypothetical protein [Enterobacter hormaechei]|uniref:hypothetical protein n=1 Tax=Enterobacter hormaechei TaxID=158836 RepID=UPI003218703B
MSKLDDLLPNNSTAGIVVIGGGDHDITNAVVVGFDVGAILQDSTGIDLSGGKFFNNASIQQDFISIEHQINQLPANEERERIARAYHRFKSSQSDRSLIDNYQSFISSLDTHISLFGPLLPRIKQMVETMISAMS